MFSEINFIKHCSIFLSERLKYAIFYDCLEIGWSDGFEEDEKVMYQYLSSLLSLTENEFLLMQIIIAQKKLFNTLI